MQNVAALPQDTVPKNYVIADVIAVFVNMVCSDEDSSWSFTSETNKESVTY